MKGATALCGCVLDFRNPETVKWYQGKIADLLKLGVGAIKVDFGEDSPLHGVYASGRTGWYEHNLYPLRYNKAVADVTKEVTGENIIWARSAWAGSQRYPLHWGGDAENTDSAMAAELRGGMSFGLSGLHLLEPRRRRLRREGAARPLSPLVPLRGSDVAHALPRCAAA